MYLVQIDHVTYCKRGGQPFTLVEAWQELDGVGNSRIVTESGRVVLSPAGGHWSRRELVRRQYRGR